ncbi:MAG: fibronectin type III domain-containing protein [Luteolibacter sp.]
MASVALNLRNLSIGEKVALGRRIFTAMSHNEHFPHPDPPLVLLARLTSELDDDDQSHSMEKNEALLGDTLARLATYVQKTSGGSESIIASSGMNVDSPNGNPGSLPKPNNLTVTRSVIPSEMSLRCDPIPGAKTYVFQSAPDPISSDSAWHIGSVSTGHLGTITFLTPGSRYWFRVSAVGTSGQGPWSDPVSEVAS